MHHLALAAALSLLSCASNRTTVRHDARAFSGRDYLKTAYETLLAAETDTEGHRVRAMLDTRAALAVLGAEQCTVDRKVAFDGPPTLAVALELLEYSEQETKQNPLAHSHLKRALTELRAALKQGP